MYSHWAINKPMNCQALDPSPVKLDSYPAILRGSRMPTRPLTWNRSAARSRRLLLVKHMRLLPILQAIFVVGPMLFCLEPQGESLEIFEGKGHRPHF